MKDYSNLRKRLEAATPGPWSFDDGMAGDEIEYQAGAEQLKLDDYTIGEDRIRINDALYIAEIGPDVMDEILTELAALRELQGLAEEEATWGRGASPELRASLDKLREIQK